MQNEPVVRIDKKMRWNSLQKALLNRHGCLSWGQTSAVSESKDVGIYRHRRLSKGDIQNDIGRFSTNSWQCLQGLTVFRYAPIVLLHQYFAGLQQVFGLATK